MSIIDLRFEDFLKDEYESTIRVEEIMWGGVMVDGIPDLKNPTMISAEDQNYLEPEDMVFGLSINGDNRAYPLIIMDWHEMANDVVGGVPVSLAYCTLCGAGIAYNGNASDGNTYDFGSSGFLFRSNELMYDRQTNTLWNQLTGEPVLGPLVGQDVHLELLPVVLTTWEDWLSQHPDTVVLSRATGHDRIYIAGAAYGDYFSSERTMFPVWTRNDLLEDKAFIYALCIDGIPKAYPVDLITQEQVVNDTLGETNLVLVAARGLNEVEGTSISVQAGPVTYASGAEVRAFQRGEHTFLLGSNPDLLVDETGAEWQVAEESLLGPGGEQLPRINGHLAYWFGWFAFFPHTLVYGS